jgi:hypothetical protein
MFSLKYRMNGAVRIVLYTSEKARDNQAALLLMNRIAVVLTKRPAPHAVH